MPNFIDFEKVVCVRPSKESHFLIKGEKNIAVANANEVVEYSFNKIYTGGKNKEFFDNFISYLINGEQRFTLVMAYGVTDSGKVNFKNIIYNSKLTYNDTPINK